jgi:hypothetical protein
MFSFKLVPRTHPVDRKRKRVSLAIIFFLLLGTVLSEDLATTYFQALFIQTDKNFKFVLLLKFVLLFKFVLLVIS